MLHLLLEALDGAGGLLHSLLCLQLLLLGSLHFTLHIVELDLEAQLHALGLELEGSLLGSKLVNLLLHAQLLLLDCSIDTGARLGCLILASHGNLITALLGQLLRLGSILLLNNRHLLLDLSTQLGSPGFGITRKQLLSRKATTRNASLLLCLRL